VIALKPCGPVVDGGAASRAHERLSEAAAEGGWTAILEAAWPALAPVFSASPYLFGLARRWPEMLYKVLKDGPEARLEAVLAATAALTGGADELRAPLRRLKAELHLLTALADLGGLWDLDAVTGALTRFADTACGAALAAVVEDQRERGKVVAAPGERGPLPGLFGLAMGKHGAGELNYSSDVDVSLFWDPEAVEGVLAEGVEPQRFLDRLTHAFAQLMQERTGDGYVFRVDLRLRPDPSSTPPCVAAPFALSYYESVGQNWERAAFIKARPVIGDPVAAGEFLSALTPFVWRRSLDFQAILDVHSIKRQIHVHKTGEGMTAAGADLKLGRGGIREIEFFAQTQQLILGGRDPALREPRTLEALKALEAAGHVSGEVRAELSAAYVRLRDLEHRAQMLEDEQTHRLPEEQGRRRAVAALAGEGDLDTFDAGVEALLAGVNRRYGELFEGEEDLSSPYGSLVFTGVENDPGTLETLSRMGFSEPATVADTIRSWHHGRIPATRTARGRELFTRLAPKLLTAMAETGAPDAAFRRFGGFFSGIAAGVQVQALFLNQPALFQTIVGVMAHAPRLARTLRRRPAILDSVLDARLYLDLDQDSGVVGQMLAEAAAADFEEAMNVVRRVHREQSFRIGLQVLTGRAAADAAGRGYTALADAALHALSEAALREAMRQGGEIDGAVAVVALGKAGSREMTAGSDLDLMILYRAAPDAISATKGWSPDVFYVRFTHRLIAALSAHTAEGELYEVDMRLRPTGSKGPVALSLEAFRAHHLDQADTWERMALTRARVVWASDADFAEIVRFEIATVLRAPRPGVDLAGDVRAMRDLMDRERAPAGFWDSKLAPGGQVDAEFIAQFRQLEAARDGGALTQSTLAALRDDPAAARSWALHQAVGQVLACAFDERPVPEDEPQGMRDLLARATGAADFEALKAELVEVRKATRAELERLLPRRDGNADPAR
jgi:[glutamine synthetase] adenylyltransferase / [glutamine synthetase]-adenylyl-L-tyrosine phosphorylase